MDQYSALVACGGDGTIFEVINAMLLRKDRKRLPVCFLPNGSGNDSTLCFEVTNIE
jgi:diacylglycerol kinase family enzyme